MISIHALHEESDAWTPFADMANYKFQSTLSMRRATDGVGAGDVLCGFQSTLSMRRATRLHHRGPHRHDFNPRSP